MSSYREGQTHQLLDAMEAANFTPADLTALGQNSNQILKSLKLVLMGFATIICSSLKIVLGKTINPADFIGFGWSFWRGPVDGDGLKGTEERDPVSMALTEVDLETADLLTCLKKGETTITGEEKLLRLRQLNCVLYGSNVFLTLWQDYLRKKAGSVLEGLYQKRGVTRIYFFGDILRSPNGNRYALYLCRSDDGSWNWRSRWLAFDWHAQYFTVVSQQVS